MFKSSLDQDGMGPAVSVPFFIHPLMGLPKRPIAESWTGRILLVNLAVFIAMALESQSFWLPTVESLQRYGVKDSAALIQGEWWRLFTPIFIHIGFFHFLINAFALYFLGPPTESLLGGPRYLFIYIVAGIFGCIGSAVFSFGLSAGASGALFGILGVGLVVEQSALKRYRDSITQTFGKDFYKSFKKKVKIPLPYRSLVLINLVLGFVLSFGAFRVDQMAHLGGLISGIYLTWFLYPGDDLEKKNILKKILDFFSFVFFVSIFVYGMALSLSSEFYRQKIMVLLERTEQLPQQRFEILSEGIRVFPDNVDFVFQRGKLLAEQGEVKKAIEDFDKLTDITVYKADALQLVSDLEERGRGYVATQLKAYFKSRDLF